MAYYTECDWCGEAIDTQSEQYVRARVEVVTGERDYAGQLQTVTEPTRFFHLAPLRTSDEWDRLGLPADRAQAHADCCYTRALRALLPLEDRTPDMGMEWRLVPVGARPGDDDHPGAVGSAAGLDLRPLWHRVSNPGPRCSYRIAPEFKALDELLRGGADLCYARRYVEAGISTVGDLLSAIADGSLTRVRGIGPKRFDAIRREAPRLLGAGDSGEARHPAVIVNAMSTNVAGRDETS